MNASYTVTLVESFTYLNDQKNPTDGVRITFRVNGLDAVGDVVVSKVQSQDKNYVKQQIEKRVKEITDLYTL